MWQSWVPGLCFLLQMLEPTPGLSLKGSSSTVILAFLCCCWLFLHMDIIQTAPNLPELLLLLHTWVVPYCVNEQDTWGGWGLGRSTSPCDTSWVCSSTPSRVPLGLANPTLCKSEMAALQLQAPPAAWCQTTQPDSALLCVPSHVMVATGHLSQHGAVSYITVGDAQVIWFHHANGAQGRPVGSLHSLCRNEQNQSWWWHRGHPGSWETSSGRCCECTDTQGAAAPTAHDSAGDLGKLKPEQINYSALFSVSNWIAYSLIGTTE